jgi:hypothetical protein
LMRPSNSTIATTPIAIGTMIVEKNVAIGRVVAPRACTGYKAP